MPELYTAEEVVQKKFIFVSYSHANKALTRQLTSFLLSKGVRLWYDEDLAPGDEWKSEVEGLIRHSNCRGVILMCSPESIASKNVAHERAAALDEREKRGKDNYYIFAVNVNEGSGSISYMQLLKKVFESMPYDYIDQMFPLERLSDFVEIIGRDPLSIMSNDPDFEETAFNGIKRRLPEVVDKSVVDREKMEKASKSARIVFPMGKFTCDGRNIPLTWQFLSQENEHGVFILKDVLDERLGDRLTEWLNGEFKAQAFSESEQEFIFGDIRLLRENEIDEAAQSCMATEKQWWIADIVKGVLQKVVREDGSIYNKGCINTKIKKGVRPVITVALSTVTDIITNQNK